ncbi:MAG: hypothetical protein V8Q43_01600 [Christensenellaceae bacterium]
MHRLLLDVREVSVTAECGILRVDILVKTNRPEAAEHNAMQAAASACAEANAPGCACRCGRTPRDLAWLCF